MTEHYSATLYGAAKLIAERGKAVGCFRDETGALCVVGAIFVAGTAWGTQYVALGDWDKAPDRVWSATEALESHLGAGLDRPDGRMPLDAWSDAHTAEHVTATLRACARAVRKGGTRAQDEEIFG